MSDKKYNNSVVLFFIALILVGCTLPPIQGPLVDDPEGTVRTLVATLPVRIELPTRLPRTPTVTPAATRLPENVPLEESIDVYFSNALAQGNDSGPERGLIDAVRQAQASVDMAIYNISLDGLASALIEAHQRGVTVRLVMESEAMDRRVPRNLMQAGIPITGDQREGLMHNKFTVIDGQEVWLGSMNYTEASAYDDVNNLVRIRDREMAQNYSVNFEEMFARRRFGSEKRPNTPYPLVDVAGVLVESYFSPDDGVARQVVAALDQAQESINVLAYSFTRDDFAGALIERSRDGVQVRVVFDSEQVQSNTGGEYENMRRAGLDVVLDGLPGLMHDKVMVIDRKLVITGSYNFSANAERTNDENLVIIHDQGIAEQYLAHFEQVYEASQ